MAAPAYAAGPGAWTRITATNGSCGASIWYRIAQALNLFAHVSTPRSIATWHARTLVPMTVIAVFVKAGMQHYLTVKVTDAGVPVGSVKVKALSGAQTTNSQGIARFTVPTSKHSGTYAVSASRSDYMTSTAKARLTR